MVQGVADHRGRKTRRHLYSKRGFLSSVAVYIDPGHIDPEH